MTDPIADMIIRIKNAQAVGHKTVDVPYSKLKYQIAQLLSEEGFVGKMQRKLAKNKRAIKINLKYKQNNPFVTEFKRISKPGKRIYSRAENIMSFGRGHSVKIISTPKGIMTGKEAKKNNLGGELIAEIW
jgi:small subunit ribosomal protein S8